MASHVNDCTRNQKRVGLGNEEGGIEYASKVIDDMKVVLPHNKWPNEGGSLPGVP